MKKEVGLLSLLFMVVALRWFRASTPVSAASGKIESDAIQLTAGKA